MIRTNRRFFVSLVGVGAVTIYLTWTGITDTMVYYVTPIELAERVEADPSFRGVGVKVGGKVVEGSYRRIDGELLHSFRVADLTDPAASFPVEYADAVPDTFSDDVEVVLEGFLRDDGVFEASTLLTKCGSRFEAAPQELAAPAVDQPPYYGGSERPASPEGTSG